MTENILTAHESYLIDTHVQEPTPGSRILALQHGGCLVQVVWSSTSKELYDAWCCFPTVPRAVKIRQLARFKKGNDD